MTDVITISKLCESCRQPRVLHCPRCQRDFGEPGIVSCGYFVALPGGNVYQLLDDHGAKVLVGSHAFPPDHDVWRIDPADPDATFDPDDPDEDFIDAALDALRALEARGLVSPPPE